MSLNVFDRGLYGLLFSDPETAALLDEEADIRAMLAVEAALARAAARAGAIPLDAGERIAAAALAFRPDPRELAAGTAADGVPVPALVAGLRRAVGGEAAAYVHWGATSQDVVDTALVLNLRDALGVMERRLDALAASLLDLADRHRATPMAARTRMRQAVVTSFGLKAAGWAAPLLRHRRRLDELRPRVLALSFGGAGGTLDALGAHAFAVEAELAAELGLAVPPVPWHGQRDGIVELGGWLAMLAGSLGKIGLDLVLLAQSEVGEVAPPGGGGSSTMPNKVNPVGPEALVALARHAGAQAGALHQAALQEHERGGAGWQLEWMALPVLTVGTAAALRIAHATVDGLAVDAGRMLANIEASQGLLLAEAAAFALSRHMPPPDARGLVADACRDAVRTGGNLVDLLAARTQAPVDWAALRDPALRTGAADALIDRLLAAAGRDGGKR
ncbi:3-carboxy-cis,cis-muconate cycloisomerase [Arenibaculum sp.]|uniref:3-carboxy-cis,cis-muconate cycloisomerase n=1 Tax=Arenibaculum sp. TaxID=2865862 RepID=UPI002E115A5F|nr:3-carboxy-cis,cis-muconate cycloisomerase [Arenibaculum sp.]